MIFRLIFLFESIHKVNLEEIVENRTKKDSLSLSEYIGSNKLIN